MHVASCSLSPPTVLQVISLDARNHLPQEKQEFSMGATISHLSYRPLPWLNTPKGLSCALFKAFPFNEHCSIGSVHGPLASMAGPGIRRLSLSWPWAMSPTDKQLRNERRVTHIRVCIQGTHLWGWHWFLLLLLSFFFSFFSFLPGENRK